MEKAIRPASHPAHEAAGHAHKTLQGRSAGGGSCVADRGASLGCSVTKNTKRYPILGGAATGGRGVKAFCGFGKLCHYAELRFGRGMHAQ